MSLSETEIYLQHYGEDIIKKHVEEEVKKWFEKHRDELKGND